jgi:hypothetical protein
MQTRLVLGFAPNVGVSYDASQRKCEGGEVLKPNGVTDENIENQLIDALEKAIQLIFDMSIRKVAVPYDTITRWQNLIEYARKGNV